MTPPSLDTSPNASAGVFSTNSATSPEIQAAAYSIKKSNFEVLLVLFHRFMAAIFVFEVPQERRKKCRRPGYCVVSITILSRATS
jgi:hypothetical protein